VLRTRPGFPRLICLPSILSDTGHTCASTHAFASSLLQAYIAVAPLPLATLRLRQAGYGLCSGLVSQSQASPISSRALPGTQPSLPRDAKKRASEVNRSWRRSASPGIAALTSSSTLFCRLAPEQGAGPDCASRSLRVQAPCISCDARGSAPRLYEILTMSLKEIFL